MTDEEMAEEYKEKHICNTCADIQDCGNDCPFSRCGVQGFLAGLKAKTQWHDLEKDPTDLPKEDLRPRTLGYYLTASKHKSYKGFVFEVAYFTGVIFTKGGDILDNVIAWCEIPAFDKEIEK